MERRPEVSRRPMGLYRFALALMLILLTPLVHPALALQGEAQGAVLAGELAIDLSSGFGVQVQPVPDRAPAFYLDYHRNEANTGTSLGGRFVLRHQGSGIRLSLGVGTRLADGGGAPVGPYVLAGVEWFFFWETEWVLADLGAPEYRSGIRIRFR